MTVEGLRGLIGPLRAAVLGVLGLVLTTTRLNLVTGMFWWSGLGPLLF